MSEILQLIENKNNEITSIQEKIEKTNSINEKEDLINKLNNIINEKIQLSKIYDKYINNQNLNSKQTDEINISHNSNNIPEQSNKKKFDDIEDERKSVEKYPLKKRKKGWLKNLINLLIVQKILT